MADPKASLPACTEGVWDKTMFTHLPCGKTAKFTDAKGRPRCGIHSDEAKAKRQERFNARYNADLARNRAANDRERARRALAELLPAIIDAMPDGELKDRLVELRPRVEADHG